MLPLRRVPGAARVLSSSLRRALRRFLSSLRLQLLLLLQRVQPPFLREVLLQRGYVHLPPEEILHPVRPFILPHEQPVQPQEPHAETRALETNVEYHPRSEKLLPGVHVAAERAVRLERDTHNQRMAMSHLDAVLGADLASHDGRGPIHQPARKKNRRRPIPRTRRVKRVTTSLHQLAHVTRHQSLHHSPRVRPVGHTRRQWIMREPRDDGDVVDHRPIIRPVAGLYLVRLGHQRRYRRLAPGARPPEFVEVNDDQGDVLAADWDARDVVVLRRAGGADTVRVRAGSVCVTTRGADIAVCIVARVARVFGFFAFFG
mmetsp:Transcript_9023/g.41014  ORF Transcript_9023/g.41014 Transcript_9023/m.41014 type:complete len:316 (-) Transcript_9023:675-1622(-)